MRHQTGQICPKFKNKITEHAMQNISWHKNEWEKFVESIKIKEGLENKIEFNSYLKSEEVKRYNSIVDRHNILFDNILKLSDNYETQKKLISRKTKRLVCFIDLSILIILVILIITVGGTYIWLALSVHGIICANYQEISDKISEHKIKLLPKPIEVPILEKELMANKKQIESFKKYIMEFERQQLDFWKSLDGWQFEHETAKVFRKNGFDVTITKGSGDEGIDLIMQKNNKKIIVQCKSHGKKVGPHIARDLYGTLINSGADEAILISYNGFTSGVYSFVKGKPIGLMTIEDILKLNSTPNVSI